MTTSPRWPYSFTTGVQEPGRQNERRSRASVYKPLFRVVIHHGYNDRSGGLCPDFQIRPTPDSILLMQAQGLVFKDEGIGFSIYIAENRVEGLIDYLRRRAQLSAVGKGIEYWTRLSFVLMPVNPMFVGITALPIDTNPTVVNLYAANSSAHWRDGMLLLAPGGAMSSEDLYRTTAANFAMQVETSLDQVMVTDISGSVVLIQSPPKNADDPSPASDKPLMPSFVQVDLSSLPLGLYRFEVIGPSEPVSNPPPLLYTAAMPSVPLCFLDMLFTCPARGMDGVYPVPDLFVGGMPIEPAAVGNITYDLHFVPRSTWWQYYIISQSGEMIDLAIEGKGTHFQRQAQPVRLPTGELATLFNAGAPLPMRQISPQRFTLSGTRRDANGRENAIRVDCLPVAPPAPVWPGPTEKPGDAQLTGISEMFVYV